MARPRAPAAVHGSGADADLGRGAGAAQRGLRVHDGRQQRGLGMVNEHVFLVNLW